MELLESVLSAYDEALQSARQRLREMGYEPTGRLKTTGTLVDKLRRYRGSSLKTVQDLAGARVVVSGRLVDQDRVRDEIVHAFTTLEHTPEIDDRRADPRSGYRAVHVIVKVDGMPIEIQIRTELQDLWAQIFERLGDTWGRAIRYGGEPDGIPGHPAILSARRDIIALLIQTSGQIAYLEDEYMLFDTWPIGQDQHGMSGVDPDLQDSVEISRQHASVLFKIEETLKELLAVVGAAIDKEVTRL